jgi:hypothetical protein
MMITIDAIKQRLAEIQASLEERLKERAAIEAQILMHRGAIDCFQQLLDEQANTIDPFDTKEDGHVENSGASVDSDPAAADGKGAIT